MKPDTDPGDKTMRTAEMTQKLEAAGLNAKPWKGRVYVTDGGGRELGYLERGDDGTEGTCKRITRRRGYVAGILRA
jgi:hypothetical protein